MGPKRTWQQLIFSSFFKITFDVTKKTAIEEELKGNA